MLPFEGIRVVEVGAGTALSFCGKLFADFGAQVLKVEPPGGDPARREAPLVDAGGRMESAYFGWLNTNKESLVADLDDAADRERLRELVAGSDVLLDARALQQPPAPAFALCGEGGSAVQVEIVFSWFGSEGPYSGFAGSDAVCRALAGVIHSAGPVEGPPLVPHDSQSGIAAGLAAFSTAAAGLYGRGQGRRRYELNVHEALLHLVEIDIGLALEGRSRPRAGINRFGSQHPAAIYPTSDGWLGIFTVTAAQWRGLCKVLGRPELVQDARFLDGGLRLTHADELDAIMTPILAQRSAADGLRCAPRNGCRWSSCRTWRSCCRSRCTASAAPSSRSRWARPASKARSCPSAWTMPAPCPAAARRWPASTMPAVWA